MEKKHEILSSPKKDISMNSHIKRGLKESIKDPNSYLSKIRVKTNNGDLTQKTVDAVEIEAVMSIFKHGIAFWNDQESAEEALKHVIADSSGAAGKAIVISSLSAGAKNIFESSANSTLQGLGGTALPVVIATVSFEVGKSLSRLCKGEITGEECWSEIKEKSLPLAGSIIGANIGQACFPIPIIGAMVGSLVGSMVASFAKNMINQREYVEANHQRRLQIEAQCAEISMQIRKCHDVMSQLQAQYMNGYLQTFDKAFDIMEKAVVSDDIDAFISANNLIIEKCGGTVQFSSMNEFDGIMNSNKSFKL